MIAIKNIIVILRRFYAIDLTIIQRAMTFFLIRIFRHWNWDVKNVNMNINKIPKLQ